MKSFRELKSDALVVLSGRWGKALLVWFLAVLLGAAGSFFVFPMWINIPQGTVLGGETYLKKGATLPDGQELPDRTILPAETVLPDGTILPAGTSLPAGTVRPDGTVLTETTVFEQETVLTETKDLTEQYALIEAFIKEYGSVLLVAAILFFVFLLLYLLLCSSVISVGYARFNLDIVQGRYLKVSTLLDGFLHWGSVVRTGCLQALMIFLKMFLLVIPGILAIFDYAMVPYLLAENPRMGAKKALKTSKAMMKGYRWKLFLLELSFIGWVLLAVVVYIILGLLLIFVDLFFLAGLIATVGLLWLYPYYNATLANFYSELRHLKDSSLSIEQPTQDTTDKKRAARIKTVVTASITGVHVLAIFGVVFAIVFVAVIFP